MLQRRKKYKNKTILGYKTLAAGQVNMTHVRTRKLDITTDISDLVLFSDVMLNFKQVLILLEIIIIKFSKILNIKHSFLVIMKCVKFYCKKKNQLKSNLRPKILIFCCSDITESNQMLQYRFALPQNIENVDCYCHKIFWNIWPMKLNITLAIMSRF